MALSRPAHARRRSLHDDLQQRRIGIGRLRQWHALRRLGADARRRARARGAGDAGAASSNAAARGPSASPSTWARRGSAGATFRWRTRWTTRRPSICRKRARWAVLRRQHGQSARRVLRRATPWRSISRASARALEHAPIFPERANISIAQVIERPGLSARILLRVWERGAGITQACGSAACATLVAAVRTGRTGRAAAVDLPGGTLFIEWRESDSHVLMTGDVELEFEGALRRLAVCGHDVSAPDSRRATWTSSPSDAVSTWWNRRRCAAPRGRRASRTRSFSTPAR